MKIDFFKRFGESSEYLSFSNWNEYSIAQNEKKTKVKT